MVTRGMCSRGVAVRVMWEGVITGGLGGCWCGWVQTTVAHGYPCLNFTGSIGLAGLPRWPVACMLASQEDYGWGC